MATEVDFLSAKEVEHLSTHGSRAVGGVPGLYLQVRPKTGKPSRESKDKRDRVVRSWILRITAAGRRREFGLGSFPRVTLAVARTKAQALRDKVEAGVDPVLERKTVASAQRAATASAVTFEACAEQFVRSKEAGWKNARYAAQVINDMRRLAFPKIGKLLVRDISTAHVLDVIEPHWVERNPTAKKLRGNIERALNYATARGYREGANPARWSGHLDQTLAAPGKLRRDGNHPSLPYQQAPEFVRELRAMPGVAAQALEVTILTAARSGEVRGMRWSELDLDAATWTVPKERMKGNREHKVPLSRRAIELIRAQPRSDDQPLVFPAPRSGGELSDMTLTAVVRRMNEQRKASGLAPWVDPQQGGREVVPHGFRASFRIWAKASRIDNDVAEAALAHAERNQTIAAYLRTDHFEARVPAMDAWARYCGGAKRSRSGINGDAARRIS